MSASSPGETAAGSVAPVSARRLLPPLLAAVVAACGGHHAAARPPATRQAQPPRLVDEHPCRGVPRATCATLRVPLDPSGAGRTSLDLAVASSGALGAPALVVLTGGPGQPGVPFLPRVRRRLGPIARRWRLVMVDQRGTGAGALRCPALQRAVGSSDVAVPPAAAVSDCARRIGPRRRFFTTEATVADLDRLRQALGVDKLALDGTSYGTYVAERYALAHPQRVTRLVLDSVVPHGDLDPLYAVALRAGGRVLRATCGPRCPSDPARDLAAVVRARHDGVALLDALIALSIGPPRLSAVPALLRAAHAGRPQALDRLVRAVERFAGAPVRAFSSGLHAATLCEDMRGPWGGAASAPAARRRALAAAAARLKPADVFPFDRATAAGQGLAQTCLRWPATPTRPPPPAGDLPPVPVLLLAGDRDLSTPLEWVRAEAARAPRGRLIVVRGSGHSVQAQAPPAVRRALAAFLR
jgi:pimeloyl-ACP methyl ester carboxylesterase